MDDLGVKNSPIFGETPHLVKKTGPIIPSHIVLGEATVDRWVGRLNKTHELTVPSNRKCPQTPQKASEFDDLSHQIDE